MTLVAGLLANAAILGVLAWAWALNRLDSDYYYRAVQEDESLEWFTFWAFAFAAAFFWWAARRRARERFPWFFLLVGLFCFFVAMEEISWGQRVAGFRPPSYFLEHNFQQELNLHNVVETDLRKLALEGLLWGYGVGLPILALVGPLRRLLDRIGVAAPPVLLVPGFLGAVLAYREYPWRFTGELVELMFGLAMMYAAMAELGERWIGVKAVAAATLAAGLLGSGTAAVSRSRRDAHPGNLEAAAVEVQALAEDFEAYARKKRRPYLTRCGIHKRVFSYVEKYDRDTLYEGAYADLVSRGLPEDRANYFIDPWNTPYWIRHACDSDDPDAEAAVFVYSFGPNRRRESNSREIRGDDIGVVIEAQKR